MLENCCHQCLLEAQQGVMCVSLLLMEYEDGCWDERVVQEARLENFLIAQRAFEHSFSQNMDAAVESQYWNSTLNWRDIPSV